MKFKFTEKLIKELKEKETEMGYANSTWYSLAQIEKIAKEIEKTFLIISNE